MSDILLDYDDLTTAVSWLEFVQQLLENAKQDTERSMLYCGHQGVAQKIDEFSGHWKVKRGELAEAVAYVAAAVTAVHDTFRDLDVDMATQLRSGENRMAMASVLNAGRAQERSSVQYASRLQAESGSA